MTRKINHFISILLCGLLLLSGLNIYKERSAQEKEKEDFSTLAQMIEVIPTEPQPTSSAVTESKEQTKSEPITEPMPSEWNLTEVFNLNKDCIGWINIPNTYLNYPIMHTPNEPQKYIHKNFYGEFSYSGVPFMDNRCNLDSANLIIYGHNMDNGTMFATLCCFVNYDFYNSHKEIYLQTVDGLKVYKIFAVLKVTKTDSWYKCIEVETEEKYNRLIADIKSRSLYQTSIEPQYKQQLLTLSTCYGDNDGRLMVIATEI